MGEPRAAASARRAASVWMVLVAACGGASPDPATQAPVTVTVPQTTASAGKPDHAPEAGRFRCEVEVRALGAEFVGEASGETGEGLAEQAKREACNKLWEAEKIDCKDDTRVAAVSHQTKITVINGQPNHSVRVAMRPIGKTYQGNGSSDESGREACQRAVTDACKNAPAGSDCSGRGLYCSASADDPSLLRCSSTRPPSAPHRDRSPFGV